MPQKHRRRASYRSAAGLAGSVLAACAAAVSAAPPASPPKVVAVGDLACQSYSQGDGEGACRSDEIAALVTSLHPDAFFPLGDIQYNDGGLDGYLRVYERQFGRLNPITYPVPGNHEYKTPGAAGYFDYFGSRAHSPAGYYSFEIGTWHVVALNSDVCRREPGCGPGTPQYEWLRADLIAHRNAACTMAIQHHPTFDWRQWQKFVDPDEDNPNAGAENKMYFDMWRLMDAMGVDVQLNAHNHIYHRWAPQNADGVRDPDGIGQFTVGTGGRSLYTLGKKPRPANLLAVQNKAFGVLEMTLRPGAYDYRWVGIPTEPAFRDSGTVACR